MLQCLSAILDFLKDIQPAIVILGIVYGIFFVPKKFIKQERIKNSCAVAKEALDFLLKFEFALQAFVSVWNDVENNKKQETLAVLSTFCQLNASLLLLKSRKEIPHDLLKKIDIFLFKAPSYKFFSVIDVLQELDPDWHTKNGKPFKKIEELKKVLLKIYEIR